MSIEGVQRSGFRYLGAQWRSPSAVGGEPPIDGELASMELEEGAQPVQRLQRQQRVAVEANRAFCQCTPWKCVGGTLGAILLTGAGLLAWKASETSDGRLEIVCGAASGVLGTVGAILCCLSNKKLPQV